MKLNLHAHGLNLIIFFTFWWIWKSMLLLYGFFLLKHGAGASDSACRMLPTKRNFPAFPLQVQPHKSPIRLYLGARESSREIWNIAHSEKKKNNLKYVMESRMPTDQQNLCGLHLCL